NLQFFHCPFPSRSRNHSPVAGRKVPIFALPVPFQSPETGKSPWAMGNLRQLSELQSPSMPLPLRSKYHFGVRPGTTTPIISTADPVQSPTTGKVCWDLTDWKQPSMLQSSNWPLPLRSRNQSPVDGRNTPILDSLPV